MADRKGGPRIRCLGCGDIVQSMYRHNFVTCSCEATSVDGGTDYTRILSDLWEFVKDD